MIDPKFSHELDVLFDNSPSVVRSSAVILVIRISGWILSLVCLGLGIAFLLNQFTRPVTDWLSMSAVPEDTISIERVEKALGMGCLVLAVLLMLVVRLCKMIMRRNGFVLNLFGWHEQLKKAARQKMANESKK